eukprot:CAMPEP_0178474316 /NCGR_PEP_ID=MMETSP0696-20121128/2539_1 /TAXON_ID=265572 /ORGANISM="Extubocellulus spinifer, Strain CCMP396" /LENGTH=95 /DNA_ID=CAMNT_0020101565 /DNA_START=501 /DNA_END=788 /DNA_ORIENTATION=+
MSPHSLKTSSHGNPTTSRPPLWTKHPPGSRLAVSLMLRRRNGSSAAPSAPPAAAAVAAASDISVRSRHSSPSSLLDIHPSHSPGGNEHLDLATGI